MATYNFVNPSSSAYFTYETVRNNMGVYDSASLKAASGSLSVLTNVPSSSLVQSDYIWSVVVPQGSSSVSFTPSIVVPSGSVNYLTTGYVSYTIV